VSTVSFSIAIISVASVICTVAIAGLAAYGFSVRIPRLSSGVRRHAGGIMVPFQVLMVPLFTVLNDLSLTNSFIGVILVINVPATVCHLRDPELRSRRSRGLLGTIAVDGSGDWRSLRVALPLVLPGFITAALFAFFAAWNEFFIVLILLSEETKYTLR